MAQLMLGNIDEGATDEEIRAFLEKYGFPACQKIERVLGDGSRPAALVTFEGVDAAVLAQAIDACNAERSRPAEPGGPGPRCLLAGTPPPDRRLHEVAGRAGFTAVGPTLIETWTQPGAVVDVAGGDATMALARQVHADPAGPRSFADAGAALLEAIAESAAEAVVLWQIEEDEAQAWHLPAQRAALAGEGLPALVMTRRDWLARDGAGDEIAAFLQGVGR